MADIFDNYRDEFRARVLGGRPRTLLEIGSGDGGFLKTVKGEVERLCGIDPDAQNVSNLRAEGFEAIQGSAEKLPFADGEFDVVVFSFTPHHIADWAAGLNEAMRVARHSVEILDVWYDDTIADQRTAHALDRWLKTIDRRMGMVHNDTLSPGALLEPVMGRRNVTFDYACRRIASPLNIEETMAEGHAKLAKVDNDPALAAEFEQIISAARREGMTDEGAILMTIEK
ncbi:MAG: class I SAM-dependent methyltransferase [Alphaproteobacteria bacterium]|nr:class I SAM-dependent methyltransferase [Alphaproteobacteria bacterium]